MRLDDNAVQIAHLPLQFVGRNQFGDRPFREINKKRFGLIYTIYLLTYTDRTMNTWVSDVQPLMGQIFLYLPTKDICQWRRTSKNTELSDAFSNNQWDDFVSRTAPVHNCATCSKRRGSKGLFRCGDCRKNVCVQHVVTCSYCMHDLCLCCFATRGCC